MKHINSYLISRVLFLCISLSIVKTEEPAAEEGQSKIEIQTPESAEGETKIEGNKKKRGVSYLEKVQRRYIARLPYLMIPVMVIPVIKKGDLAGYLTIMVELKGTGVESYRALQADLIRIRDEIFCDLYVAMSRLWLGPKPPSANVLENRIKKRINTFYKKEMAETARLHIMQLSLLHAL